MLIDFIVMVTLAVSVVMTLMVVLIERLPSRSRRSAPVTLVQEES
jgi:hypothetical protein